MNKLTRKEIFDLASQKLRNDFNALTVIPHSALKGSEAENIVKSFLNDHLPRRFAAGSGFIIDINDQVSKQTDLIIYDSLNCPVYRVSDNASIFPNDNVAAVIEVKSTLDKDRLRESFENIAAAKKLIKTKAPDVSFLVQTKTLGCLFAFDSSISLDKISQHYFHLLHEFGLGVHIDIILVLDKGIVALSAKAKGIPGWNTAFIEGSGGSFGEGSHIAISHMELKSEGLDWFFRILLAHLIHFRSRVDHPGFNWTKSYSGGLSHLRYITSFTQEKDPEKRKEILKKYKDEVVKEFGLDIENQNDA